MPTTRSARKRLRQNERRRRRNQAATSHIKTLKKKVSSAIESGNQDEAKQLMRDCVSAMDKAARKNVLHKRKVARDKSRLCAAARRHQVSL